MQALPAETILHVCNYLSQKDVASFRRSCKRHADLGAVPLFRELHLMFSPKSFENLRQIANNYVFADYVKSIFYEAAIVHLAIDDQIWENLATIAEQEPELKPKLPQVFESKSSILRWEREMQIWDVYYAPRTVRTKGQITRGRSAFRKIQKQTAMIVYNNVDRLSLEQAFYSFPNLEEISMQTDCKASETMRAHFKSVGILPAAQTLRSPGFEDDCESGTRQLSSILEACVVAGTKLRSLSVANLDWSYFGSQPVQNLYGRYIAERLGLQNRITSWAKPYHKGLEHAFHHLNQLDFRFESKNFWHDEVDIQEATKRESLFGRAIRSATNLKSLALDFGDLYFSGGGDIIGDTNPKNLKNLIGKSPFDSVIWPHLTSLELHLIAAPHEAWIAFLKAHSPTLRDICLSSLKLTSCHEDEEEDDKPNWSKTLSTSREFLQGKNLEFRGLFTSPKAGMDMDRLVGKGSDVEPRPYGYILRQWFLNDRLPAALPFEIYARLSAIDVFEDEINDLLDDAEEWDPEEDEF